MPDRALRYEKWDILKLLIERFGVDGLLLNGREIKDASYHILARYVFPFYQQNSMQIAESKDRSSLNFCAWHILKAKAGQEDVVEFFARNNAASCRPALNLFIKNSTPLEAAYMKDLLSRETEAAKDTKTPQKPTRKF